MRCCSALHTRRDALLKDARPPEPSKRSVVAGLTGHERSRNALVYMCVCVRVIDRNGKIYILLLNFDRHRASSQLNKHRRLCADGRTRFTIFTTRVQYNIINLVRQSTKLTADAIVTDVKRARYVYSFTDTMYRYRRRTIFLCNRALNEENKLHFYFYFLFICSGWRFKFITEFCSPFV